jgi:(1->4)-alpha-D-glucan 1-alpha-D-glucosylmutase
MATPAGYLRRLAENLPSSWLVIEKILAPDEELDPSLPVAGTTGYEVMRLIDGVFVDPAGEPALTALANRLTGDNFYDAEHDLKLETGSTGLRPELRRIARLIGEVPGGLDACIAALAELAACVPVYRADYSTTAGLLTQSVAEANHRAPQLEAVLSTIGARLSEDGEAATRFHQVCGAITAKSIEDKLFYRTTRLTSLNEVGGDPRRFAVTPGEFHLHLARQAREWPGSMTTLSTHDTKRAVDVRARIAVLAEIPDEWARTVEDWSDLAPAPEASIGYLLWQTLVGCWPVGSQDGPDTGRVHAYATKAVREAGVVTSWNAVNAEFERQLHGWLDTVLSGPVGARIAAFADKIAPYGWSNSLGATILQLAGPGVPDTYAGCELWDYSLVDPDNRRPVDFGLRRELLLKLTGHNRPPTVDSSGAAKLWLISRALRIRQERSDVFVGGGYAPLLAYGPASVNAVSFCRQDSFGVPAAIAVATRLPAGLDRAGGWRDTTIDLPAGTWADALTGTIHQGSVPVSGLLDSLPVALLTRS